MPDKTQPDGIFISCVSDEFEKKGAPFPGLRKQLRGYLARTRCNVRGQKGSHSNHGLVWEGTKRDILFYMGFDFGYRHYQGSGHVWQGCFKPFPVQSDNHHLTLLRYAERNPLPA